MRVKEKKISRKRGKKKEKCRERIKVIEKERGK